MCASQRTVTDLATIEPWPSTPAKQRSRRPPTWASGAEPGTPRLNLGDCFSYALAKADDEPLLLVGQDFIHAELRSAMG